MLSTDQHIAQITSLPLEEQLAIVSAVWDRMPQYAMPDDLEKIKAELDRRMDRYRSDPSTAMTLEEFKTKRAAKS